MRYLEKVLQPDESVVYATSLHWFVFLHAAAWTILTALAFVMWLRSDSWAMFFQWYMLACLALAVLSGLHAWIQQMTTELAITTRRVIYKTGLLRRRTVEMNLSKVESVGVTQSVFGRLFGYGQVELKGTGASDSTLPLISDPLRFRSHITAG